MVQAHFVVAAVFALEALLISDFVAVFDALLHVDAVAAVAVAVALFCVDFVEAPLLVKAVVVVVAVAEDLSTVNVVGVVDADAKALLLVDAVVVEVFVVAAVVGGV